MVKGMKIEVVNNSKLSFVGRDLIKAIYSVAHRLEATEVIINKAKYNDWADCELNCEDGCIDWHYIVCI